MPRSPIRSAGFILVSLLGLVLLVSGLFGTAPREEARAVAAPVPTAGQQVATFALMGKGQFFWLTSKCPPSSKFKEFSAVSR